MESSCVLCGLCHLKRLGHGWLVSTQLKFAMASKAMKLVFSPSVSIRQRWLINCRNKTLIDLRLLVLLVMMDLCPTTVAVGFLRKYSYRITYPVSASLFP